MGNWYPKSVYHMNEDITRRNMAEYDRKREAWWAKAEEMFPNYRKRPIRERMELRELVNEAVGYRLG